MDKDKMTRIKLTFGIICLITCGYIIFEWLKCYPSPVKEIIHPTRFSVSCSKKTSIFFLKTHKCGSSTMQNIFMRFGKKHNLNFVLPEKANYVGNPEKFSRKMIGKSLALENDERYDIFTHHTRYDYDAMKGVMKENAPFVTIMRDPVSLQQSLYNYYHLFLVYKMPLKKLLNYSVTDLKNIPRVMYKLGWNQMAWDLGVNIKDMRALEIVDPLIEKVEREFDLVMIMEYAEASLVLLADLMCWPLEDVRFFKLNAKTPPMKKTKEVPLSDEDIKKLEQLNFIDVHLYEYFRQRLKERIINYGTERMFDQVKRLVDLNEEMFSKCVDGVRKGGNVQQYLMKSNASFECEDFVKSELDFTAELQEKQRTKVEVLRKLQQFLVQG